VYPNPKVASFVSEQFIPVRLHVKTHPGAMERFGAQWTPTILILDPSGKERHRIEGYLDAEPFIAQLKLGLAHAAFANQQWDEAERLYQEAIDTGDADVAPEAAYWIGVTRYKRSGDANELAATHDRLSKRFPGTTWAKKASVWAA
jgi:tetratricopeptide (TPR) repeat protein